MESVARVTFASLAEELQAMIFDKLLEDTTEVIRYIKSPADSKKPAFIKREVRNPDSSKVDVAGLLLVSKSFNNIIPPILDKLPKMIKVSSREECKKLRILLKMKQWNLLLNTIVEAKFYIQPCTNDSYIWISDLFVLRDQFKQLENIVFQHYKTMRIHQLEIEMADGRDQHLMKSIKNHFEMSRDSDVCVSYTNKLIHEASINNIVLGISTSADLVLSTGGIEHKYIECVFNREVGTVARFESRKVRSDKPKLLGSGTRFERKRSSRSSTATVLVQSESER